LPDAKKNTNQHVNKHAEIETSVELLSLPPEGTKKNIEFLVGRFPA
jgi:hypothetical protein